MTRRHLHRGQTSYNQGLFSKIQISLHYHVQTAHLHDHTHNTKNCNCNKLTQNQGTVELGKDLWRSYGPTPSSTRATNSQLPRTISRHSFSKKYRHHPFWDTVAMERTNLVQSCLYHLLEMASEHRTQHPSIVHNMK